MDVQPTNGPEHPYDPPTVAASDAHAATAPKRRWLVVLATAVAFALAGGTIGVVVADDTHEVADLESDVEAAAADVGRLEDDLDDAEERLTVQADVLAQCRDTAELSLELVEQIDELTAAYTRYALTPPGSDEEAEADELGAATYLGMLGASTAMQQAAAECVGDETSDAEPDDLALPALLRS